MAQVQRRKPGRPIATDRNWEAAKAARRNVAHHDAAQESAYLERQFRKQWSSKVASSPVDLLLILRTLTQKKISFVLTGAHGIGGWTGKPRATHDVDILVRGGRNHARAVNAMRALYPELEVRAFQGVTGFFIQGEKESVIDVIYPHRADLEETLANPVWTEDKVHGLRYRIPSLEAALANKYGSMMTITRDPRKRAQDSVDFAWMVGHSADEGRDPIDLPKLADLAEKANPGKGGKAILQLVDQVKAGKVVSLR